MLKWVFIIFIFLSDEQFSNLLKLTAIKCSAVLNYNSKIIVMWQHCLKLQSFLLWNLNWIHSGPYLTTWDKIFAACRKMNDVSTAIVCFVSFGGLDTVSPIVVLITISLFSHLEKSFLHFRIMKLFQMVIIKNMNLTFDPLIWYQIPSDIRWNNKVLWHILIDRLGARSLCCGLCYVSHIKYPTWASVCIHRSGH